MDKVEEQRILSLLWKREKEKKIRNARGSFWEYAKLKAPDFYFEGREYLETLCNELQEFYFNDDKVLIVNMPPRHGKSRSVGLFVEWLLGENNKAKIMTGSYNETLSQTFSKGVRNSIMETKADEDQVIYNDIFPSTRIKRGDSAANLWGLEGGHYNYLATSPTGTATGFGADLLIIDDLIKNAEEAFNERILGKHWDWFTQTMLSRLQEGGKIIIIMTRWATGDLAGRAKKHFAAEGTEVQEIKMKALQDNGEMLDEDVLSYESYKSKIRAMGQAVGSANYQQEPINVKGKLYTSFKTYSRLPQRSFKKIISYTDTADTGSDYLCTVIGGLTFNKEIYILDVQYTKENMEVTEPETADILVKNKVDDATIESNNGGRGFSRNVKREIWERHKARKPVIHWFHQNKNKQARIFSNATFVMNNMYFPENWADKWPDFYEAMNKYQKEGKNEHDDAPDTVTGLGELITDRKTAAVSSANVW